MKGRKRKILALSLAGAMTVSMMPAFTAFAEESSDYGQPNGGAEVTLWHYFDGEEDTLNQFIKTYNESQSDIYIVPTFVSREELMKQYTIGAVSGDLPDIGMVDSPDMASYISLGVFADITDYVEDWEELDQFFPGPMASTKDSEGRIYGIPINSNCLALLCNMDILGAAGVRPPETWEDLRAVCEAVTDPDDGVYGLAISAIGNEEGTFQFIPWLYTTGGSVEDVDNDGAVEALTYLTDLVNDGLMSREVVNWGQGDAYNAWSAGKAAILESGTWYIAQKLDDIGVDFEYQFVMMPSEDGNRASVIGGENYGVCSSSDHVEECVAFLKDMMSAENNAEWCELAGKIPVRADAAEFAPFLTEDERYAVFYDSMDFAVARGPHESWPLISEALYTAEQSALLGEKTPEEALAEAAAVINPILEESPILSQ